MACIEKEAATHYDTFTNFRNFVKSGEDYK